MLLHRNWLYVSKTDDSTLCNYGWKLGRENDRTSVRFVRGHKMKNLDRLFDEVSAAFQFPYYFGENYDALSECLGDLDWIDADRIVMIITRFDEVLQDEKIERPAFGRALKHAVHEYGRSDPTRNAAIRSFYVILNSELGSDGLATEFVSETGKPDVLGFDGLNDE